MARRTNMTRRHRFGDQNAPATAARKKIQRQDTPHQLTLDSEGNFKIPDETRLTPSQAERLGALEAKYAQDLQTLHTRGVDDAKSFEDLKNAYKLARRSVFTPEHVYQNSEDLEGFAANDLNAHRGEIQRRNEAAEHQTWSWKIKSAFNKIIGKHNAFGKTSKRTGHKKKYTKKSRHGFNGYHNTDY